MITLLVLYLRGTTINVMILAGLVIAIGAVVDDAIVDVENIVRRLRQHRQEGSDHVDGEHYSGGLARGAQRDRLRVADRNDGVAAGLLHGGPVRRILPAAGHSYVLAVLVSLLVALTVTPALILILLSNAPIERPRVSDHPLAAAWLRPGAGADHPHTAPGVRRTVGVIMVAGLAVLPLLGQELLPSFKERDFLMHWMTKPGTSHPEMVRITTEACQELRTIPGVRNCGSHIGQALLMDEVYGINFTENWISVDPAVDYDETLATVQELVDGYPGLYRDVQTYLKERIREVLTGSSDPIVVRIYGQDLEVLRDKAEEVEEKLCGDRRV